jgi:WD40 repeat protein
MLRIRAVADGQLEGECQAHTLPVAAVALSPDRKFVATADLRGELRLWDRKTLKMLTSQAAHIGNVRGIAFSPDGKLLATAGHDHAIRIWRVPN